MRWGHQGAIVPDVGSCQLGGGDVAQTVTARFVVDFFAFTLYESDRATDRLKQRPPTFTVFARADGKW